MEFFIIVILIVLPIAFYLKKQEDGKLRTVLLRQKNKRGGEYFKSTFLYLPKLILNWDNSEVIFSAKQGGGGSTHGGSSANISGHLTPAQSLFPSDLKITINSKEKSLQQYLDKKLKIIEETSLFNNAFQKSYLLETTDPELTKKIFADIIPAQLLRFPGKDTDKVNIQIHSDGLASSRSLSNGDRLSISIDRFTDDQKIWDWLIDTMELLYTRLKDEAVR